MLFLQSIMGAASSALDGNRCPIAIASGIHPLQDEQLLTKCPVGGILSVR
jgi:hypothetical protein